MILWSTKNVDEIDCNDYKISMGHKSGPGRLDGAVAAWYFDGEVMQHNYLLEKGVVELSEDRLDFKSSQPSSFEVDKGLNKIRIGDDFKFNASFIKNQPLIDPEYEVNQFPLGRSYSLIWAYRLGLTGKVMGDKINGSAYFQRVFVNAPAPPWYWGLFHFENGAVLSYHYPYLLGVPLKKEIIFYDGVKMHEFSNMNVERVEGDLPLFKVSGASDDCEISFCVESYSHSSWTFKKKTMGIIPNKLVYNEYPAKIIDFAFADKKTGKKKTLANLGNSVGNAEHTTGILL